MKNIIYLTAIVLFAAGPARGLESTITANNFTAEQIAANTGLQAADIVKPVPFQSALWWRNLCCMEHRSTNEHGVFSMECRTPAMQALMARCDWSVTP